MRLILSLCFFGFVGSISTVADARDSFDPVPKQANATQVVKVWLRDGSFYRGEPVEVVPKNHITLQLHDGKTLRIEWSKIVTVDGIDLPLTTKPTGPHPPTKKDDDDDDDVAEKSAVKVMPDRQPSLPVAVVPPGLALTPMSIPPGITATNLRVTGMQGGALVEYLAHSLEIDGWGWQGIGGGVAEDWKPLCAVPCTTKVDASRALRIRGAQIINSDKIFPPTRSSTYEMEIKPGWRSYRTAAWVIFGLGGGLLTIGGLLVAIGFNEAGISGYAGDLKIGGAITAGIGTLTMIGSAPLFTKSQTTVEFFRE